MNTAFIRHTFRENKGFLLFLGLMLICRSSLADWYSVPTGSMKPTIIEGDRIFVNKLAYQLQLPLSNISVMEWGQPERGDIVVFESKAADERLIKRVIGIPGDRVEMNNNQLVINDTHVTYYKTNQPGVEEEVLDTLQHQVQFTGSPSFPSFKSVEVPDGHILVLGDNRNNSADSRYYGFVPFSEIQGKATTVVASLDPENYYKPRTNRVLKPLI